MQQPKKTTGPTMWRPPEVAFATDLVPLAGRIALEIQRDRVSDFEIVHEYRGMELGLRVRCNGWSARKPEKEEEK